jgi:hypothetical protein
MSWPSQQEYNEAIQNPQICFEDPDLRSGTVECNQLGLPKPRSGNFATVYKFECGGKKWAVRCFNRQTQDQQQRYAAINAHLHQAALPYTVGFTYLMKGIRARAQWYPIVKMEWADGVALNTWVENNLHNRAALMGFLKSFVSMLSAMQRASIAHGDLQHGNILVVNSAPVLVDYDGMYVPALSGRTSSEVGQPNYQNPRRTAFDFGPYLDNFSGWVIVVSLFALTVDPKLWQTFKGGDDCLLFRKADFEGPNRSALIKALDMEPNQDLHQLVALFKTVMACSPQSVPSIGETFSIPSFPAPTVRAAVPDWIQYHLPPTPKPATPQPTGNIGWLLDATSSAGPPLQFENPIAIVRAIAYFSLVLLALAVELAIRNTMPLLLLSAPSLVCLNLLIWRGRYRKEPAIPQLNSVVLQRSELRERVRVMDSRIKELELEKERINRQASDLKSAIAKEERELLTTEQKLINVNAAKLQSTTSSSLQNRQKLDSQETAELNALQNSLGKTVSGLSQSIAALTQAETNDLTNALKVIQVAFVQGALQKAWIRTAPLSGIAAGYKSRLEAARIFTAADIDYRIHSVKGIGSQRAAVLENWRRAIEADARGRMPQAVSWQEQSNIKSKYQTQKSALESQLNRHQGDLSTQQAAIRAKYAGLIMPLDAILASERQKHQAEAIRITVEFNQKRAVLATRVKEADQDAIGSVTKCDARQNEVRKETFSLQWRMGRVEREIGRFARVSFGRYAKHVLIFS